MQINVLINCKESFKNKARYVFETFFQVYRSNWTFIEDLSFSDPTDIVISYGVSKVRHNSIYITPSDLGVTYFEKHEPYILKNVKYKIWQDKKIPFLFDRDGSPIFEQITANIIRINSDIITSSFYFLSQWETSTNNSKDKFGRFPWKESLQFKLNLEFPIVNEYFDILWSAIKKLFDLSNQSLELEPLWPNNKKFAVCLTHDIDCISRGWIEGSFHELLGLKDKRFLYHLERILKLLHHRITKGDIWWNFGDILKLEKNYNVKSSFYFISERTKKSDQKYKYNVMSPQFIELFKKIKNGGCEVGIQGSFMSYNNSRQLQRERDILTHLTGNIYGIRQHFLRLDIPETWRIQETLGFKYDVTLGFVERWGYRSGFAFPYFPYDIHNDVSFKVLEIPLNLMDMTLQRYCKSVKVDPWTIVRRLLRTTREYKACLCILWHNTFFDDYKFRGGREIYEKILDFVNRNNGWGTSARNIERWWNRSHSEGW